MPPGSTTVLKPDARRELWAVRSASEESWMGKEGVLCGMR